MNRILEVRLPDDVLSKLERIGRNSDLSAAEVAEKLISSVVAHEPVAPDPLPFEFDSLLNYALNKNEELLNRLAK
jgi:hypothetical protein